VAVSTMWPPLTATTSPARIGATANSPRPAIALGDPFLDFGEIHDETVIIGATGTGATGTAARRARRPATP
jgi:hypothetical protein